MIIVELMSFHMKRKSQTMIYRLEKGIINSQTTIYNLKKT